MPAPFLHASGTKKKYARKREADVDYKSLVDSVFLLDSIPRARLLLVVCDASALVCFPRALLG